MAKIKRKKTKRLKKSAKIFFAALIAFFLIGGGLSLWYVMQDQTQNIGKIETPDDGDDVDKDDFGSLTGGGQEKTAPLLTYEIVDVGQGDAIIIDYGDVEILIDAGPESASDKVVAALAPYVDGELDYVIATHLDPEHLGGMGKIYETFDVKRTLYGSKDKSDLSKAFFDFAEGEGSIKEATDSVIDLGHSTTLTIYRPLTGEKNENNNSVITLLTSNDTSFLYTSDAEAKAETRLKTTIEDQSIDVVVAGNHGKSTSNTLLGDISPRYFVISSGGKISPDKEVLDYAKKNSGVLFGTYKNGNIIFTVDKDGLKCNISDTNDLSH